MSEEISRLALVVDSRQVVDAHRDLAQFERAGAAAEAAANALTRSMQLAGRDIEQFNQRARQAATLAQQIDQGFRIGGSGIGDRAADIAAYGRSLDDLRARYNPLFAAGRQYRETLRDIGDAARVGALSERERVAAIAAVKTQFVEQVRALRDVAGAGAQTAGVFGRLTSQMGLSSHTMQNLSYQLNDVFQGLLLGASPMQIMMQQGPQVVQALQMTQGGLSGVARGLMSLVTPTTVAITGLIGIGAAGVTAVSSWASAQAEVQRSLQGIGRASGATVSDINRIAEASASIRGLSVSQAREAASQMAATGRVAVEVMEPATRLVGRLAKVLGTDAATAAGTLTQALADPLQGFDALNARLGFGGDRMRELVRQMVASGDAMGAQKTVLGGITEATRRAAEATGFWATTWNILSNSVSNFFDRWGQRLSNATGIGQSLEDQLRDAESILRGLDEINARAARQNPGNALPTWMAPQSVDPRAYAEAARRVDEIRAKMKDAADQAARVKANLESLNVGPLIRDLNPDISALRRLTAMRDQLRRLGDTPGAGGELGVEELAAYEKSLQRVEAAIRSFIPAQEQAIELSNLQRRAVDAQSPGARAAIAARQMEIQLSGEAGKAYDDETKQLLIRNAAYQASGGVAAQIGLEQQRISTLGELATVGDRVRNVYLSISQARQQGVRITTDEEAALLRIAAAREMASRTAERAQLGLGTAQEQQRQAELEIQTLLDRRVITLQEVAAVQAVYTRRIEETVRQIEVAKAALPGLKQLEQESGSLRMQLDRFGTEALRGLGDTLLDFQTGAKSGSEALRDFERQAIRSLLNIANQILIIQPLAAGLQSLFAPLTGGGAAGGILGLFGVKTSHTGGIVGSEHGPERTVDPRVFIGAPRFHSGGIAGDEVPIIARKNEGIFTPRQMRALGAGGGSLTIAPQVNVTAPPGVQPGDGQRFGDEVGRQVVAIVRAEMVRQKRDGGLLGV